jgi:osmotically-inducible protein OsmY
VTPSLHNDRELFHTRLAVTRVLYCNAMMKLRVAMLILVASATACVDMRAAPAPSRAPAGHRVSATGAAVTARIRAHLLKEQVADLPRLQIDTDAHGVVRLRGRVASTAVMAQVLAIAQGTEGVEAVRNELNVRR